MLMLFSFSTKSKYPDSLSSEHVEFFESERIKTISDAALNDRLEYLFSPLFDEVSSINAQYSNTSGYYYLVFGSKDGIEKIDILKVEKSDIENGTYSYIDFTGVDPASVVNYCRRGSESPFPFVCQGPCQLREDNCLGEICGVGPLCDEN